MEILGFFSALVAVLYASYRHHRERALKARLDESQEEKWFSISLCLMSELNRIGRRDLVINILNKEQDESNVPNKMDDLKVPDFLPEDF